MQAAAAAVTLEAEEAEGHMVAVAEAEVIAKARGF
jgi:hypothetical protein